VNLITINRSLPVCSAVHAFRFTVPSLVQISQVAFYPLQVGTHDRC